MNCTNDHKELEFIRWENRNGVFFKVMQCKKCKELIPVLADKADKDAFNEGD